MERQITRFRQQMDLLPATIRNANITDPQLLASALNDAGSDLVMAVGSGGSLITCEFLRLCRAHALGAETLCLTPLAWIARSRLLAGHPLWLFSAGGNNADILSATQAAMGTGCPRLDLLTANPVSPLAETIRKYPEGLVHGLSGLAEHDAFLAVHSLMGSCLAIVRGFQPWGQREVYRYHALRLADAMEWEYRRNRTNQAHVLFDKPHWLVLFDPLINPAAIALETGCHELGLASVQVTDFRNFAHGRHVGLFRMRQSTTIIALVTPRTEAIWNAIRALLPDEIQTMALHYHASLPWTALHAIGDVLAILEQVSEYQNLDAAKPGVPDFGKAIYAEASVLHLTRDMDAPWQRKARINPTRWPDHQWATAERAFRRTLRQTVFRGLLLDFDGTVVSKPRQPAETWVRELFTTLLENGSFLGIASGRGDSLMEELRLLVPEGYWDQVLVGYYNGGLLLPLSEFFDPSALTPSQALCKMAAATKGEEQIQNLVRQINSRPLQYSLFPRDGISVDTLAASVSKMVHTLELNTELRMVCSGHSVDVIPMTSTKRNVLAAMMSKCQGDPSNAILCIGDKGGQDGNDWDLLGTAFGLSVAEVCDRPEVCWNLLPPPLSGPEGLRYYGQCIQWVGSGFFLFNPT